GAARFGVISAHLGAEIWPRPCRNICLLQFSCCGGVSYKDWSQNMYFNCTPANPSQERCSVPFSCCLQDTHQAVVNTQCGWGVQARGYLEAGAVIYTSGCVDTLGSWIHGNLLLLGGIALGLGFFFCVFFLFF
uniref:Tetraspanin-33 n=1 Tax=Athene cunicularia TaxID=194338 RepID=A0A663M0K6_ATHCN